MIDRKEFRRWLSKRRFWYVGMTAKVCHCPIARFLHTQGHPKAWVGTHSLYWKEDAPEERLPYWATEFVLAFDALSGRKDDKSVYNLQRPKMGFQAIKVLDGIA